MPNIRERLLIGAPPDAVYAALTTQEGLSSWWTPDVKASPELGSTARFGFQPPYIKEMRVTDLKPGQRVAWRCIEGAEEWKDTTLTFEIEGSNKESLLAAHLEMADQVSQQSDAATATLLTSLTTIGGSTHRCSRSAATPGVNSSGASSCSVRQATAGPGRASIVSNCE